jgi:nephrocystin-3
MAINTDNREIRVFISSTFKDMEEEREHLIKNIFPKLRSICLKRSVSFTDIDLRWGITEDQAQNGGAVAICLEEIDKCRPYFIGLMGERYGWTPQDDNAVVRVKENIAKDVQEWCDNGRSVTEMEMIYGVLQKPEQAPYSYFYFCASSLTEQKVKRALEKSNNQDSRNGFYDDGQGKQEKLNTLKSQILKDGVGWNASDYTTIEMLGQKIEADLLAVIDSEYPEDQVIDAVSLKRQKHEAFARGRRRGYIPDTDEIVTLVEHTDIGQPIVITGQTGSGKSALMAVLADNWHKSHPESPVIAHYAGAGDDSSVASIIGQILTEINQQYLFEKEIPSEEDKLFQALPEWFASIPEDRPLLLLLDGINQYIGDTRRFIAMLPEGMGAHVKILISALASNELDYLTARNWYQHTIEPLTDKRQVQLIESYLGSFNKTLPEELVKQLINSVHSSNPLYLKILLDELRVDASHETLSERISDYLHCGSPKELYQQVIARWKVDYGESLTEQVLGAIWGARFGLSYGELRNIIVDSNQLALSQLLFGMGEHLCDINGLHTFMHDALRQAVGTILIKTDEHQYAIKQKLIKFFQQQDVSSRQIDELPWLYVENKDKQALQAYLMKISVFDEFLWRPNYEVELFYYWREADCDAKKMATEYEAQITLLGIKERSKADKFYRLGVFFDFIAAYTQALDLHQKALVIRKDCLGKDHLDVATSLNNMAEIYGSQSNYKQSLDLNQKALLIRKASLGELHPDIAESLDNMALDHNGQGNYDVALELSKQALKIRKTCFGENHPHVAASFNNLACIYEDLGNYDKALECNQQSLLISKACLGDSHPDVAVSLNNLAGIYSYKSNYESALEYYEQALLISKSCLGDSHPDVSATLSNMALIYTEQGDYENALDLNRQALKISTVSLGDKHLSVASIISNLGLNYDALGDYENALKLLQQALKIRRTSLGENHPDVATSLSNIATIYSSQEDNNKALKMAEQALEIRRTSLGENHPDVATSLSNIAAIYSSQEDNNKALALYQQALKIEQTSFGENHPNVATTTDGIGGIYHDQGNYKEALELSKQALKIRKTCFGENHPDVATSLSNIATIYSCQEDNNKALALYQQALKIRKTSFGENHPHVAMSLSSIADVYTAQEDYDKALEFHQEALEIRRESLELNDPDIAESLTSIAEIYEVQEDYDKALEFHQEALEIRRESLEGNDPDIAESLTNIAEIYGAQEDYDKALEFHQEALEIRSESLEGNDPDIAESLTSIAEIYGVQEDYGEALEFHQEALEIRRESLDENDPDIAESLNSIALIYYAQDEYDKALEPAAQALKIRKESLDDDDPDIANSLTNVAAIYEAKGDYSKALKLAEKAFKILKSSLGKKDPDTLEIQNYIITLKSLK